MVVPKKECIFDLSNTEKHLAMKIRKQPRWDNVQVIFSSTEEMNSYTDEMIISEVMKNKKYADLAKKGVIWCLTEIKGFGLHHGGRQVIKVN